MGRHGKNLSKSVPLAKPMPDLGKYAYKWEKELVADHERRKEFNKGFEQGVFTSLAVTYNVLLFHYKEMANVKRRVQVFEMYFNTLLEKVQTPDEEQQFAEWYYQECTGFEMLRKENETMANKQAKINVGEMVSKRISDKGYKNAEVAQGINKSVGLINNLRYGQASKKTIDAVMQFLGEEFTAGEMAVYKEAYGVGNNDTSRFEAIEARIIEHEAAEEEKPAKQPKKSQDELRRELDQAKLEYQKYQEEVKEVEAKNAIPVPEELPEAIAEVINHEEEDLPFADCNEMYKEAQEEAKPMDLFDQIEALDIEALKAENKGIEETIALLQANLIRNDKLIKLGELWKSL